MFPSKKATSVAAAAAAVSSNDRPVCVQGDSGAGLVLTTDPKPRLRWTVELHERFVDAVTQLGGPDSTCRRLSHCARGSSSAHDEQVLHLILGLFLQRRLQRLS